MQQQIQSAWRSGSARDLADGGTQAGSSFSMSQTLDNVVIDRQYTDEPYLPGEERTYIATFMGEPYSEEEVTFKMNGEVLRTETVAFGPDGWGAPQEQEGPVWQGWYLTFTMPAEQFTISVNNYTETFSPDSVTPEYGTTYIEQARTDTPRSATAGQPFDVEVSVGCDDNNQKGCESQTIDVLVDGKQVTSGDTGIIGTDSREKLSFTLSIDEPGDHTITFDGAGETLDRTITIESGAPAVSLGPVQSPGIDTLNEGQSAGFTSSVANDTDQSQTAEVIWRVSGIEVDRSTHTVSASTEQTISHSLSYNQIYNAVGSGYREVTATLVGGDGWDAQQRLAGGFLVPEPSDDGGTGGGGGDDGTGGGGRSLTEYLTPTTLAAAGGGFFLLLLALVI